jgi:Zn-dependent peptidase ImmA (M78 family)
LGHYFLDEHRNALITGASKPHKSKIDFSSDLEVEKEADLFAANLLMPRKILKEQIGKSDLSANMILNTADFFGTSISSTAIRIRELNLFPFLLLKTRGEQISWIRASKKLKKLGLKYPIKRFHDLSKGCLTQSYSNNTLKSSKTLKQGTTASSWFNSTRSQSSHNLIMIEEVISLGAYGLITIVYPDKI